MLPRSSAMNKYFFRIIASSILLMFAISSLDVYALETTMMSDNYQLVKISNSSAPWKWDETAENKIIDLHDLNAMLDKETNASPLVKKYIENITEGFTKSIHLKNIIQRDDTVYFSRYWTRRNSVLNIIEFEKLGMESDLNQFLGPIASIPTVSYGHASFNFHYKGETLSFKGAAIKSIWALRKTYWVSASAFFPFGENGSIDIAVIDMGLPINYMDNVGTFVLIPKNP